MQDAAESRRWEEDLDFLAGRMPAVHANLFHAVDRRRFEDAVAELRRRVPELARHQIIVELMRLAATIGDGHTCVAPWREPVGFHTLPISLYRFADGYHVRASAHEQADLLGAQLTHVGGVPIDSAQSRVAELVGRDNDMSIAMYAPLLLVMPEVLHALGLSRDPRSAELTVESAVGPRSVTLHSVGEFELLSATDPAATLWGPRDGWSDLRDAAPPLWLSRLTQAYWFEQLPGDLFYCQLNAIEERDEPLEAFFTRAVETAEALGVRRFVLDLRHNNGGDGTLNTAIVRPFLRSAFDRPGGLFVITGRRTFSAAQMLICELERWSSPLFVGEPAASRDNHYGDSELLVLPNHPITVRVSTRWWQFWDDQANRPWIPVDLEAPLTVDAYRSGRDPALEAIATHHR